jgi:gluconate 2-dehydrogenase gamma chain
VSERREFLQQAALFFAALAGCRPSGPSKAETTDSALASKTATSGPPRPTAAHAFSSDQRRTLEAATSRILPSDHDPGAKEANVIEYIDRELARPEWEKLKKIVVAGVVGLERYAERLGHKEFADLPPAEQDDIIGQVQRASERGRDFIKFLVMLTIEGFVADPMYGGNLGGVGWKFIGYAPGNPDGSGEGGHGGAHH